MRQVLLRAVHLLKRPAVLVASVAVAGGGCALVALPLFGVPGFELGGAVAAGIGILGGIVGAAAAFQERRLIQGRDPRPAGAERSDSATTSTLLAMGAATLLNVALTVPPFVAALAFALTSSRCDPFSQGAFYPVLTLPSALVSAAAGVCCGFAARGPIGAGLRYGVLLLASAALTGWPIYFGPQVFAYNLFAGYFPGPLYDEALAVRAPLLWFRLETVAVAAFLWLFSAFFLDMREGRIAGLHFRPGALMLLALLGVGIGTLEQRAPQLGTRTSPEYLEERLGGWRDSAHFHLVYPRGKTREEVERMVRDLEFRHQQLSDFLGGAPNGRISVFLYRSAEEKEALVGASNTQFAKPWRLELHINDGPFPSSSLKHELAHVMAAPYGTGPFRVTSRAEVFPNMGVIEGLAVAADDPVNELTLHEWAAGMRHEKLAPDLRSLFQPQGFYANAAARAYTYAGSFLRYLSETYGKERLQALYGHGDFERAYGRSLESLAAEWEGFLDKLPLDAGATAQAFARFRQGSIFARRCAREVVKLAAEAQDDLRSDPERALALYQRCATLQPEEPSFEMSQAAALEALDRKGEAARMLEGLQEKVKDKPGLLAEVLMTRADLASRMDRKPEAKAALEQLLAAHPSAASDRTAQVKLAALDRPEIGPALWAYFRPGHEDVKLLLLRDALAQATNDPILLYLLGRRLEQGGAPALGASYLKRALAGELPASIRRETLRLGIEADYLSGDCNAVRDEAGHLPDLGAPLKAQALEWVQRCDFEARTFKGPLVPADAFR
jgi:hypothetical protein